MSVGHIPAAGSCPVMNLTFYEERSVVIHQGMSSVDKEQATTSVFIPSFRQGGGRAKSAKNEMTDRGRRTTKNERSSLVPEIRSGERKDSFL